MCDSVAEEDEGVVIGYLKLLCVGSNPCCFDGGRWVTRGSLGYKVMSPSSPRNGIETGECSCLLGLLGRGQIR